MKLIFSQPFGYWWPGATAPGHQWLQCLVYTNVYPFVYGLVIRWYITSPNGLTNVLTHMAFITIVQTNWSVSLSEVCFCAHSLTEIMAWISYSIHIFLWAAITYPCWTSVVVNWPNAQIPECSCSKSHKAPFRTEICTFLFWMKHCGIWNRCIMAFFKLVY